MNSTTILIGPLGAGKTTVGRLLAEKLNLPFCSVDNVRLAYYQKAGYDKTLASQIAASEQGIQGVLRYSKPFEARMVEKVLADHHGIIDFGASNSVYDDKDLFARIENALAPYPNVILLLPSPDMDESVEILKKRLTRMLTEAGKEFTDELFELNEYFVKHPSNHQLAKLVIYTKDKTPEEICDELVQKPTIMPFYRDYVYPHLVDRLGAPAPIQKIRQQIIPLAHGAVLEIGAGSGANFTHYDAAKVTRLYALEPNPGMLRLAQKQLQRTRLNIEFIGLPGERLPLDDNTIDTVVSTFTLCTIPGIREAIQGLVRVLKPDGRLIFLELGLSPDPAVRRWQKRLEPLQHWLFQGLYLTRDIPALLMQGGFQLRQMEMGYIAQFPKSLTYCWWGIAVPQS